MKLWNKFAAKRAENAEISGGRSKRPQNRPNTPQVLSDVYNSGTRAKKLQAQAFENAENGTDKVLFKSEKNSSVHKKYMNFSSARKGALDVPLYAFSGGRSMVEMLGVLAIIGVLSVGAIAGYQKAMFKHKANKQTEQINTLLSAISRLHPQLRLNDGSTAAFSLIPLLKKLGEIPEDMYITNGTEETKQLWVRDVFANSYRIYHHNTGYVGMLTSINASNYSVDICKNLYMAAEAYHNGIDYLYIGKRLPEEDAYKHTSHAYGDSECSKDKLCLKDLTVTDTDNLCRICGDDDICVLYFIWR